MSAGAFVAPMLFAGAAGLVGGFVILSFFSGVTRSVIAMIGLPGIPCGTYEYAMSGIRGHDMAQVGAGLTALVYGIPAGVGWALAGMALLVSAAS